MTHLSILGVSLYFISVIAMMLVNMPIFTLFERKILSYMQNRKGPKKVSLMGLLQPVCDGVKLLLKELILPSFSNQVIFFVCPMLSFLLMCMSWLILNLYSFSQYSFSLSMLMFLCLSSLKVFTLLGSGWSSKSKYSSIGCLRGIMQVMSYEMGLMTLFFLPCVLKSSLKFFSFFDKPWSLGLLVFPIVLMFMMSLVGETNRAPFDFAEGESELVSGFNVEYGSFSFALLFLAEYGSMILVSMILAVLFFLCNLFMKMMIGKIFCFFFIVFRGSFPRWRIDFLVGLGWKIMLPLGFLYLYMLLGL